MGHLGPATAPGIDKKSRGGTQKLPAWACLAYLSDEPWMDPIVLVPHVGKQRVIISRPLAVAAHHQDYVMAYWHLHGLTRVDAQLLCLTQWPTTATDD